MAVVTPTSSVTIGGQGVGGVQRLAMGKQVRGEQRFGKLWANKRWVGSAMATMSFRLLRL